MTNKKSKCATCGIFVHNLGRHLRRNRCEAVKAIREEDKSEHKIMMGNTNYVERGNRGKARRGEKITRRAKR